ncbi:hypothetical protein F66182_1441 [Fusarium sp. NRRL 66182]|nr:hypothetical protein F66182_1441 [Fusarium sp. NRRL 66182]
MEATQNITSCGAAYPTKHRRNHARSKTGCLTCRTKRKKCDEIKPTCSGCTRTGQPCIWPPTSAADGQECVDPQAALTYGNLSNLGGAEKYVYKQYWLFTADMLVKGPSADGNPFITIPDSVQHLRGFVLELYAFLALKLSVTPRACLYEHPLEPDPFLQSLGFLKKFKAHGFMLGFGHRVFETIPAVSQLVQQRYLQEQQGLIEMPSLQESYQDILERLRAIVPISDEDSCDHLRPEHERAAATILYRNALILYLYAAFHQDLLLDPDLAAKVAAVVQDSITPLLSLFSTQGPLRRMLLWPAMMIASCCRFERHIKGFRIALNAGERTPGGVKEAARLIEILWQDKDPAVFGPRGLLLIMRRRGLSFSMC